MIGDRVRIGRGQLQDQSVNVPIYDLKKNTDGSYLMDHNHYCFPVVLGGAKGGSYGTIEGTPAKVMKSSLVGSFGEGASLSGNEPVYLYPIFVDQYKRIGWLPVDFFHIVGHEEPQAE